MANTPITADEQRELFKVAVELLGGIRPTATAIGVNDRTVGRLLSGALRIHDHTLEKIANALILHAEKCRILERRLSPVFAENRTEAQAKPPKHDGNFTARTKSLDAADINRLAQQLGIGKA